MTSSEQHGSDPPRRHRRSRPDLPPARACDWGELAAGGTRGAKVTGSCRLWLAAGRFCLLSGGWGRGTERVGEGGGGEGRRGGGGKCWGGGVGGGGWGGKGGAPPGKGGFPPLSLPAPRPSRFSPAPHRRLRQAPRQRRRRACTSVRPLAGDAFTSNQASRQPPCPRIAACRLSCSRYRASRFRLSPFRRKSP